MKQMYRFVMAASVAAVLGLNGCDSDVGSKADSKKTCEEVCEEDEEFRCSMKGLKQCKPDENGCASWSIVDPCEGKTCDPASLECVDDDIDICPNACDPSKATKKCDGEDVYICEESEVVDDCYTWVHDKTCDHGQHCDASSFECVDGCAETCDAEHSIRCSGEGLEQCAPDEIGCASWSVVDPCEGGTCNSQTLKCVMPCDNQCADGDKQCDGNGIASCTKDENGCMKWSEPDACGENQTCDPETIECSEVCNSNCPEVNAVENHAASQKVCTDVNGKGCLQWVETKCAKGERFDAEQNQCVLVCGDDCDPFTIVFLPDTQYYTRNIKKDSKGNFSKTDGSVNIFKDQLQYIRDYGAKTKHNMKAVIHLGDVTDSNAKIAWQFANSIYKSKMDDLNMPYTIAPGNHDFKQCEYAAKKKKKKANDMGVGDCKGANKSTYKREAFMSSSKYGNFNNSRARVKDYAWFKGKGYYKNYNSYITFRAANIDFLVIALEWLPRKGVVEWADNIISQYPNHKVIIETHSYLSPKPYSYCKTVPAMNEAGQFTGAQTTEAKDPKSDQMIGFSQDATDGKYLFENLVSKHNNIILVVSGHVSGSCFRLNKGYGGNVFAEMVVDYQSENGIKGVCIPDGQTKKVNGKKVSKRDNGGAGTGWLRELTFDPKNLTITASSNSTLGNTRFKKDTKRFYCTDYYPQDRTKKPEYIIDMDAPEHRFTNHHAFVVNFDFVTPVDYKVTTADGMIVDDPPVVEPPVDDPPVDEPEDPEEDDQEEDEEDEEDDQSEGE